MQPVGVPHSPRRDETVIIPGTERRRLGYDHAS